MIEMHVAKKDWFTTPKTRPVLSIVLPLSLLNGKRAFCRTATIVRDALFASIAIWVLGIVFTPFVRIAATESPLFSCHLARMGTVVLSVIGIPFRFVLGMGALPSCLCAIRIALFPILLIRIYARSALRFGTACYFKVMLWGVWLKFAALWARLKQRQLAVHSVSLSLYHRWTSADGVIARRSGSYSLADYLIIP